MPPRSFLLDLDRLGSSYSLLLTFLGLGVLAALLFWSGIVGRVLGLGAALTLRAAPTARLRDAFAHLLADSNPRLRLLATGCLLEADANDAEAAAALVQALADPTPRVRRAALEWVEAHTSQAAAIGEALKQRRELESEPELSDLLARILEREELCCR